MMRSTMLVLLWSVLFTITRADFYTAIHGMEPLIETQKSVIQSLDAVVGSKRCKVKNIKMYLSNLKKEQKAASANISHYLGNPLNCYKLIKSLSIDLDYVRNALNGKLGYEIVTRYSIVHRTAVKMVHYLEFKTNKSLLYPTREDFHGAVLGLLRLQSMYLLNRTELSEGLLATNYSRGGKPYIERFLPMTIGDCYELAMALYNARYFDHGVMWMHEALRKFENQLVNEDHRYSRRDILHQLNYGYDSLDRFLTNFQPWIDRLKAKYPTIDTEDQHFLLGCYRQKKTFEEIFKTLQAFKKYENNVEDLEARNFDFFEENIFFYLCRNEFPVPPGKIKRLKCYYKYGPHPFLRLARVKTELLHRRPNVVMFHDVISDAEIQQFKDIPEPLKRCEVQDGETNMTTSPDRICKGTFLDPSSFPLARVIRRRVSQITNLDLVATERLVLTNYGIGGHFAPHYDFWLDNKTIQEQGNRIATTVFYLSDVEQGGATVFLELRLTIFPVKGAAVFWWDLLPSGEYDFSSFHTGCPVLRGNKWILTQWINTWGQERKRPCPANYKKDMYLR